MRIVVATLLAGYLLLGTNRDKAAPAAEEQAVGAADREVWNRTGVFIAFRGLNPADLGRKLKANHCRWAIVPLHDPANRLDRAWIEQLRAPGILVGGGAYLKNDPEADAARDSGMLRELDLSFFVANTEAEYKADAGGD